MAWCEGDKAEVYKYDKRQRKYPNLLGEIVTIKSVSNLGLFEVKTDYGHTYQMPRGWLCRPGAMEAPTESKPKKPSELLQEAGIAVYKAQCRDRYKRECRLIDRSINAVSEQVKSGDLVISTERQLHDFVWKKYEELGGTDLLQAKSADKSSLLSGKTGLFKYPVNLGAGLLPDLETKAAADRKKQKHETKEEEVKEMEPIKTTSCTEDSQPEKVSFDEVMQGFEAIVYAKSALSDNKTNVILADLALTGLRTKVCGKVIE